jgi:hypothetical protein
VTHGSTDMTMPTHPATSEPPDTPQAPEGGGQHPGSGVERASTEVWQALFGLIRPPERRATIGVMGFAPLVAAICWYFGVDAWHSILIGIALTTVGLSSLVGSAGLDRSKTDWRGDAKASRDGARSDIAQLSSSLRGSYGRIGGGAVWRVQRLARHSLALHELDLLDPEDRRAIEQLVGRSAYAILVRGERRPPLLRSLLRCLDELDKLNPARPTAPPLRSRRRMPTLHRLRRTRER